ncbi:MAG: hypothetical protein JWQ10_2620, partial [Herbaspirillum sp.]|nr:hypothetical protein [Herbaspirillum sp.]
MAFHEGAEPDGRAHPFSNYMPMKTNRIFARPFSPVLMMWALAELVLALWPSMLRAQSAPGLPPSAALNRLAQQFYDTRVRMGLVDLTTRASAGG